MGFWQLGNTSVRSALRIKDGLTALSASSIQGNIRKGDGDIAFRRLLGECGVVSLGEDATNSVGRKWRAAMGKLGFIYPRVESAWGFTQDDLGPLDTITPAGWNLVRAETVAAIQECFLRAMATPLFPTERTLTFSPLCWTLALLLELERRSGDPALSFVEMACIVQTTTPLAGQRKTVDDILQLRARQNSAGRKRVFDRELYASQAVLAGCSPHTFIDYADMNIRYLKATGMVCSKGKGIALVPEKRALALSLAGELLSEKPLSSLYCSLCTGTKLPTDDAAVAHEVLTDLLAQLKRSGIVYSIAGKPMETPSQINQIRYKIEALIAEKKEETYARQQAAQWEEIAAYMKLIASRRDHARLAHGEIDIRIPRAEAPAYLEWILWRAFLAIGNLTNKPYEARRFKIDQDFMPVGTAPGNGPDLIAEFDAFVIVIEVTLSESSRQEAMEGEPVRRHVADLMLTYEKPVYGLFIANRIDSNTAETFRIGVWYTRDDKKLNLNIIPVTLERFAAFFQSLFLSGTASPQAVVSLIDECERCRRECEAPEWKQRISEIVDLRTRERQRF